MSTSFFTAGTRMHRIWPIGLPIRWYSHRQRGKPLGQVLAEVNITNFMNNTGIAQLWLKEAKGCSAASVSKNRRRVRSLQKGRAEARTHKALLPVLLMGNVLASIMGASAGSVEIRLGISDPGKLSITAPWQGDYRVECASQPSSNSNLWHAIGQFSVAGPSTVTWMDLAAEEATQKFYRAAFETIPLPDGWARLNTNPNFAIHPVRTIIYIRPSSGEVFIELNIYLKNLCTGEEMLPFSFDYEASCSTQLDGVFVDPAAKAVICSRERGWYGGGYWYGKEICIRNLTNFSLSTSIPDSTVGSVDFSNNFAVITTDDGIVKTVNIDTMHITLSSEEEAYLAARSNTDAMRRFIWGYILKRNYTELVSWASGVAPYYSLPIAGTRPLFTIRPGIFCLGAAATCLTRLPAIL